MGGSIPLTNEMLIAKGIPEAFLMALGMHILTQTKINWRKLIIMVLILFLMATGLRALRLSSGINTVLSLFGVLVIFQFLYRSGLQEIIRTIIAPIVILIFISIAEMLNLLILAMIYGFEAANTMIRTPDGWTQCLYSAPSTIILALLLLAANATLKMIRKRKKENGNLGEETRE
jgi:hypothetical protein